MGAELGRVAETSLARAKEAAASESEELLDAIAGSVRRIRGSGEPAEVLTELVDSAPRFCRRAVMLLHRGGMMVGFRSAGPGEAPDQAELDRLSLELASAPAIAHAVESKDTVVTAATQDNLSQKLWKQFALEEDGEVRVYPLVLRNTVLAVLLVDGPTVRSPAIEALVLTAEAWIEVLGSRQEQGQAWKSR